MSESRVETFLKAAMTEEKETNLPKPRSRVEELLQNMAENGVAGGDPPASGSANIDVTAEVGQTIVVEEVDGNGKPTKWKAAEYQPRTHWIDERVLYDGTPEFDEDGESQFRANFSLTIGKTYKVIWNNTEYICEAKDATSIGYEGGAVVGNLDALLGTGDTGEPFIIGNMNGYCLVVPLDDSSSVTLSIIGEKPIPIPMCYIPEYVYQVHVSQFSSSGEYEASELPKSLILAAYNGIPLYMLITDDHGRAVKIPASFTMAAIAGLVQNDAFAEYAENIPSTELAVFFPSLYARGMITSGISDYVIRFVKGGD